MDKWIDIIERPLPLKLPIRVRFTESFQDKHSFNYITEGILVSSCIKNGFGTDGGTEIEIKYSNGEIDILYGLRKNITYWLEEINESILSRFEILDL